MAFLQEDGFKKEEEKTDFFSTLKSHLIWLDTWPILQIATMTQNIMNILVGIWSIGIRVQSWMK